MITKTDKLKKFLDKYSLGKKVPSAVVVVKDGVMSSKFASPTGEIAGQISMNDSGLDDGILSIYNTQQLKKMVSVLGTETGVDYIKDSDGNIISLEIKSNNITCKFTLAEPSIINTPAKTIDALNLDYFTSVIMDTEFVSNFKGCLGALQECNDVTVVSRDGRLAMHFNYSENINIDRMSFDITDGYETSSNYVHTYDAVLFDEILKVNSDVEGVMRISNSHVVLEFATSEFSVKYLLGKKELRD